MSKISFLDVLASEGITPEQFIKQTEGDTPDEVGYKKIKLIVKFYNKDKKGKAIYYPWFWVIENKEKPSGSGLSLFDVDVVYSSTYVASRLKYIDQEDAREAGKIFLPEYEEYMLS